MASLLPTPEPADPVEGAPGHFTHSNWVKQSVKNLDVGTVHTDQLPNVYGRNRIINGDFSVNQRGFSSGSAVGGYVYSFDRWLGVADTGGGTAVQSVQVAAPGLLPESAKQYYRMDTVGNTGAASYVQFFQRIEDVRTLSGKNVTVSFWASSNQTKIGVNLVQFFGSGGSPSAVVHVNSAPITVTGTWTRHSVTLTLPSIAGKTLGTNNDSHVMVSLWLSSGSNHAQSGVGIQNGQFNIWGVQVEEGSVVTPYEQKSYGDELRVCQRYYVQMGGDSSNSSLGFGVANNNTTGSILLTLPVPMRAAPSMTQGRLGRLYNGPTTWNQSSGASGVGAGYAARQLITLTVPTAGGMTAGFPLIYDTAILEFSAEL